jgi:hypothetical protein
MPCAAARQQEIGLSPMEIGNGVMSRGYLRQHAPAMIPEHLFEKVFTGCWIGKAPFIGHRNQRKPFLKRPGEETHAIGSHPAISIIERHPIDATTG